MSDKKRERSIESFFKKKPKIVENDRANDLIVINENVEIVSKDKQSDSLDSNAATSNLGTCSQVDSKITSQSDLPANNDFGYVIGKTIDDDQRQKCILERWEL